jgi:hypothetical protein
VPDWDPQSALADLLDLQAKTDDKRMTTGIEEV